MQMNDEEGTIATALGGQQSAVTALINYIRGLMLF